MKAHTTSSLNATCVQDTKNVQYFLG